MQTNRKYAKWKLELFAVNPFFYFFYFFQKSIFGFFGSKFIKIIKILLFFLKKKKNIKIL
jgi:hypothetical protein